MICNAQHLQNYVIYLYASWSKAALNVYTRDVAGKYPNLKVNAFCPGLVDTDLGRPVPANMGMTPEEMGMKTSDDVAEGPVLLIMGDISLSGQYFGTFGLELPKQ